MDCYNSGYTLLGGCWWNVRGCLVAVVAVIGDGLLRLCWVILLDPLRGSFLSASFVRPVAAKGISYLYLSVGS